MTLGLAGFLYNSWVQSSAFCKFACSPPHRLDDSASIAIDRLSDYEREVMGHVKEIYCVANNCEARAIKDADLVKAVRVSKAVIKKIERFRYSGSDVCYGSACGLLKSWKAFCIDQLCKSNWNMPMQALHPANDLWRRFEHWLSTYRKYSFPLFWDNDEYEEIKKEQVLEMANPKKQDTRSYEEKEAEREVLFEKISKNFSTDVIQYSEYIIFVAKNLFRDKWQDDAYEIENIFDVTLQILEKIESKGTKDVNTAFAAWQDYVIENKDGAFGDEPITSISDLGTGKQYWLWKDFESYYFTQITKPAKTTPISRA